MRRRQQRIQLNVPADTNWTQILFWTIKTQPARKSNGNASTTGKYRHQTNNRSPYEKVPGAVITRTRCFLIHSCVFKRSLLSENLSDTSILCLQSPPVIVYDSYTCPTQPETNHPLFLSILGWEILSRQACLSCQWVSKTHIEQHIDWCNRRDTHH